MNFGGGNNPPWARQPTNAGGNYGGYNTNFNAQQNVQAQPGLAMPTSLGGGGSNYPARTAPQQNSGNAANSSSAVKQRVFTGVITKVSDNFGFVDEDVFFQTSVCKGGIPKLGDRVLVEATFNANMPFKWNASRIQLIPNQPPVAPQQQVFQQQVNAVQQQMNALQQAQLSASNLNPILNQAGGPMGYGMSAQPPQQNRTFQSVPPPAAAPTHVNKPAPRNDIPPSNRASRFDQRERRDDRRDRQRSPPPPRKRSRSPIRRKSRSPKPKSRSKSPKRKVRAAPRYSVSVSPLSLDMKACSVIDVKNRYNNMYIPSDFYHLSMDWSTAFPLHRKFNLGNATKYIICHKDMHPVQPHPENVDPSDADYSYSAKVMLLSQPSMLEIYKKCCSLAEDNKDEEFTHPARVMQFLVGLRAKNEPLAIGGPWSPSLDGPDPATNPQTLIKTAIRTTKALTGIDLSTCTQWYRFIDISYLRGEETHKGKTIPEHTEHVVMFLPDVWSVVPSMMDYLALQASYKRSMLLRIDDKERELRVPLQITPPPAKPAAASPQKPAAVAEEEKESKPAADAATSQSQDATKEETTKAETSQESGADTTLDEDELLEKREPTHWSELDPKTMKVVELRAELEARNLPCKGLKSQLQAKLSKVLKQEMEADEEKGETEEKKEEKEEVTKPETATTEKEKEETKQEEKKPDTAVEEEKMEAPAAPAPVEVVPEMDPQKRKELEEKIEREMTRFKNHLERNYWFPDEPTVLVHPNRAAKNGKFDCSVMSLSVLLDYRPEDNKEHSFEVSLFAESFNEMLMRDFGFSIYKKLNTIPEKKEEPKKEKKDEVESGKNDKNGSTKEGDKKGSEGEKDSASDTKSDSAADKSTPSGAAADTEKKSDKDKSAEADGPARKKRKEDDDDDKVSIASSATATTDRKKTGKEERRKWVTVDKEALLAFVYYDTTHTGYIEDKDLEDMFYTLGMQVSRAQVRAIVQKHCSRDALHYRRFTDKPEQNIETVLANQKQIDIVKLAKGNKIDAALSGGVVDQQGEADSGVVMYNGAVLELDKVMSKLDKSENNRLEVERQMRTLQDDNESLKSKAERSDEKVKRLSADLKKTTDKLQTTKSDRNRREDEVSRLKDILHTASRELHSVSRLVDNTIREEKEERSNSGAERYTPSRDASSTSASTPNGTVEKTPAQANKEQKGSGDTEANKPSESSSSTETAADKKIEAKGEEVKTEPMDTK